MHIITQIFTILIILLFNAYIIHILRQELLE
jgi:cbb3-type cytochrome oxidase subunit 3